ncbi:hypothetical protein LPJ70_003354, partial [Coemansia sp. RSA 2708]
HRAGGQADSRPPRRRQRGPARPGHRHRRRLRARAAAAGCPAGRHPGSAGRKAVGHPLCHAGRHHRAAGRPDRYGQDCRRPEAAQAAGPLGRPGL